MIRYDKIILGTVQLGLDYGINNKSGKPNEFQSYEILNTAQKWGINRLDTADSYGSAIDIIGKYHKNHTPFLVLNKFVSGDNSFNIRTKLFSSLKTLGVESFEVYSYHSFNDFLAQTDSLRTLITLKEEGLIRKIGVSVYGNQELETAIDTEFIDVIQLPFNILDNYNKKGDLIKRGKLNAKEIHVRSVYLQGLLFMENASLPAKLKPLQPYLKRIYDYRMNMDLSIEELALTYVMLNEDIDGVLIGVDNSDQLSKNLDCIKDQHANSIVNFINSIDVSEIELLNPANWKRK